MSELCDLTAVELRRLIGAKQISPVELLASCRARIERVNGAVNAVRRDLLRAGRGRSPRGRGRGHGGRAARAAARPAGRDQGPGADRGPADHLRLAPVLGFCPGQPTSARSRRSARAGGIVVGKTNTPEFGAGANTVNPVYGATGNPFDPEKTCAGSSGGSAVALATGMVPLATGSDMGGSLRNPAAYCGVVGFRPSPGAVPHFGPSPDGAAPPELGVLGWSPLSVAGRHGPHRRRHGPAPRRDGRDRCARSFVRAHHRHAGRRCRWISPASRSRSART